MVENWSVIREINGQVERIKCGGCNLEVNYRGESNDLPDILIEMENNEWLVANRIISGSGLILEDTVLICPRCQDNVKQK